MSQLSRSYPMHRPFLTYSILCLIVGGLGGIAAAAVGLGPLETEVILGMAYGLGFAILESPRATTPGAGLLWGLAYALLLWLTNPLGALTRSRTRVRRTVCSATTLTEMTTIHRGAPTNAASRCLA